jgi:hypothetical protein
MGGCARSVISSTVSPRHASSGHSHPRPAPSFSLPHPNLPYLTLILIFLLGPSPSPSFSHPRRAPLPPWTTGGAASRPPPLRATGAPRRAAGWRGQDTSTCSCRPGWGEQRPPLNPCQRRQCRRHRSQMCLWLDRRRHGRCRCERLSLRSGSARRPPVHRSCVRPSLFHNSLRYDSLRWPK